MFGDFLESIPPPNWIKLVMFDGEAIGLGYPIFKET